MPSENWGKQISWPPKTPEEKKKETSLKSELEKMSMTQLRKYVKDNKLKAKDTDKEELIEEILAEVGGN